MVTTAPLRAGLKVSSLERAMRPASVRVTPGSDASAVSILSASNSGEVLPEAASTFSHSYLRPDCWKTT